MTAQPEPDDKFKVEPAPDKPHWLVTVRCGIVVVTHGATRADLEQLRDRLNQALETQDG